MTNKPCMFRRVIRQDFDGSYFKLRSTLDPTTNGLALCLSIGQDELERELGSEEGRKSFSKWAAAAGLFSSDTRLRAHRNLDSLKIGPPRPLFIPLFRPIKNMHKILYF